MQRLTKYKRPSCRSMRFVKYLFVAILMASSVPPVAADPILDWNQIVLDTVRIAPEGPTTGSRAIAMAHVAMYDAYNSIDRGHLPYHFKGNPAPATSVEAAVAAAAHGVLASLYPSQQTTLDDAFLAYVGTIPDSPGKLSGIALGKAAATDIVDLRSADGASAPMPYAPGADPGDWQPTFPDFRPALSPGWGAVTPFSLDSSDQFRPGPPPLLGSPEYAAAYAQVKSLGEKTSAARTAEQTEIGLFWAYDVGQVGPPPILYNEIARTIAELQGNEVGENARLFALLNLAQADAGIATWEAKYVYDFWRPITAIRGGDMDGNPDTDGDPLWEPLGAPGDEFFVDFTPPFPAYTSGHAAFGAAALQTIAAFYATDLIELTIGSDEFDGVRRPLVERSYTSLSDAVLENALSRIYLGIHWEFDATEGITLGSRVAGWVFANELRPVPEPSTASLLALGLGLVGTRRVTRARVSIASAARARKGCSGATANRRAPQTASISTKVSL